MGGLGYKISVNEIGADSAGLGGGGGGWGLNTGFTSFTVVNSVLPVKVGVDYVFS